MRRFYKFSELGAEHQGEVVGHLGRKAAASTRWELVRDFPIENAVALASDLSVMVSDHRVRSVVLGLEAGGKFRPILVDEIGDPWIEGIHRSFAAEELGYGSVPALVRVG